MVWRWLPGNFDIAQSLPFHLSDWLRIIAGVALITRRPTWHGYVVAFVTTSLWAGTARTVNTILGTNYGFVSETPGQASPLDLLGPWPWYVVNAAGILAVAYALMTWPWTTRRALAGTVLAPSGWTRRAPVGARA